MASYLINLLSGIQEMSYLEIGAYKQNTFRAVNAKKKVCIDPSFEATFKGTSDNFFLQNKEKFDVIYIDGDHTYETVIRDFNNSVGCLNSGGCIFLHDLYPMEESLIQPWFCGTAFKFRYGLYLDQYKNVFTQDSDYGLTLIKNPEQIVQKEKWPDIDYSSFKQLPIRLYSRLEMETICQSKF